MIYHVDGTQLTYFASWDSYLDGGGYVRFRDSEPVDVVGPVPRDAFLRVVEERLALFEPDNPLMHAVLKTLWLDRFKEQLCDSMPTN